MNDMKQAIIPKSDQLNADDLLSGPITVKITGVTVKGGQEQPVAISYEGDNGKPYKACKSMCRVLVTAWGADSSKYVGRSLTLYCDSKVKWGGMEVGGIRISHMSDIPESLTMALTVTRANKKPFTVKPLASGKQSSSPAPLPPVSSGSSPEPEAGAAAGTISADMAIELADLCAEARWNKKKVLGKLGVKSFEQLTTEQYQKFKAAALEKIADKVIP